MKKKRHSSEEVIGKLREAEALLGKGETVEAVCRAIDVTPQTYYR